MAMACLPWPANIEREKPVETVSTGFSFLKYDIDNCLPAFRPPSPIDLHLARTWFMIPKVLAPTIETACLLEATARKPGNVHPLARFADCDWDDFRASASAIAPILAEAPPRQVGRVILEAVRATRAAVGKNTNLGMILLIAPLAAATRGTEGNWSDRVHQVVATTTVDDCRRVYEAIRLAQPGGLRQVDQADISDDPAITLTAAMTLAAPRDLVARQYTNGFREVIRLSHCFTAAHWDALELEILQAQLESMARDPDTLIARKCGWSVAEHSARLARDTLEGRCQLKTLDQWLRADGHRRNPGTTADRLAAGLFVALWEGRIPRFEPRMIHQWAERARANQAPLPSWESPPPPQPSVSPNVSRATIRHTGGNHSGGDHCPTD